MGGKGGGSQPQMPDFSGLAREQATYDWYANQAALQANRPNIYTPWGQMVWTRGGGSSAPPWNTSGIVSPVPGGWGVGGSNTLTLPGNAAWNGVSPNAQQRSGGGYGLWNDIQPGQESGIWPAGFGVPFLMPGDVNQNPYAEGYYNDIRIPGGNITFSPGGGVSAFDPQNVLGPYSRGGSLPLANTAIGYLSAQSGVPTSEYDAAYSRLQSDPSSLNWWMRGLLGQGQNITAGQVPTQGTAPPPTGVPRQINPAMGAGGATSWLQQRNGIWYNVNSANNKARPFSEPYPDQGLAARLAGGGSSAPPSTGGSSSSVAPPGVYALPGGGSIQVNSDGSTSAYDPAGVLSSGQYAGVPLRDAFNRWWSANNRPGSTGTSGSFPQGHDPQPTTVAKGTGAPSPVGSGGNDWALTVGLPPEQQAILNAQNAIQLGRSQLAGGLMGEAAQQLGTRVNYNQLPNWASTPIGWPVTMGLDTSGLPDMPNAPGAEGYQRSVNFGGAPGLPNVTALRDRAEDALYSRAASRLDPMWNQRQQQLDIQLRNQGLRPGTEAYDTSMREFERARTDAYQTAINEAVMGGGAEAQRQFGMGLEARQQSVGETMQQAQFLNQAVTDTFQQAMARGDFEAARRAQAMQEELQRGTFANAAAAQEVQEQLQLAQFQNMLRTGVRDEQLAKRIQAINEMTAIMNGQQIQQPQFPGFQGMAQQAQGPDLMGAASQGYQGALQQYGIQQQQQANMMGGLFGLAGMLPMLAML